MCQRLTEVVLPASASFTETNPCKQIPEMPNSKAVDRGFKNLDEAGPFPVPKSKSVVTK